MATVSVSSFAEFAQAVTVSGDTVVCPNNAVWDFNELYPGGWLDGYKITANCAKIQGNGTTIKNMHSFDFLIYYQMPCEVNELHVENFVSDKGMIFAVNTGENYFNGCKFSGIVSDYPGWTAALYNSNGGRATFTSCAFTLESPTAQAFRILWGINSDIDVKQYCRIKLYLPNSPGYAGENTQWSQINVDCPAQTVLNINRVRANVYGGDLPQVSSVSGAISQYISLFNSEEIPNLASTASIIGCTTEQLHDAAYLSSLGFPIGVEE